MTTEPQTYCHELTRSALVDQCGLALVEGECPGRGDHLATPEVYLSEQWNKRPQEARSFTTGGARMYVRTIAYGLNVAAWPLRDDAAALADARRAYPELAMVLDAAETSLQPAECAECGRAGRHRERCSESGAHEQADPAGAHRLPESHDPATATEREQIGRWSADADGAETVAVFRAGWDNGVNDLAAVFPDMLIAPEALDRAARALSMDDGSAPEFYDEHSDSTVRDKQQRALWIIQAAMGTLSLDELAERRGYSAAGGA